MSESKFYLKGGVSVSKNQDNITTKTTTWIYLTPNSTFDGWFATQSEVEAWAGAVGDNYREPTMTSGVEITSYTENSDFVVSDISINLIDRTHYEVVFTNIQAKGLVHLSGNGVQTTYDENGFMTKTTTWVHHGATEDEVIAWAGKQGDSYKKPTVNGGKLVTEFTEDESFIVTGIDVSPSGVSTYSVTFTNTQAANLVYLKDGVSVSIDENGFITKTTTWVHHICDSSFMSIIGAQANVEAWAGSVGDAFKNPKPPTDGGLATDYTEDNTFIVSNVSISMVDKTHYEVNYTNIQNTEVLKIRGNVSVNVSNNNEITKSVNYVLTVPKDDYTSIDANIIKSGTTVDWAGSEFLVESSSYNATSPTQYDISITAKDMSVMMIGLPSIKEDGFGQKTINVSWRYSEDAYNSTDLPKAGDKAGAWFGEIDNADNYVITSVNANPDGVLGYIVEFNAKDVSKRVLQVSKEYRRSNSNDTDGLPRTVKGGSLVYQGNSETIQDFNNIIGTRLEDEAPEALSDINQLPITGVSISQEGNDDFKITVDMDSELGNEETEEKLSKDVSISMTQAKLYLTPQQCGYASNVSDLGYYPINNPPQTTIDRREAVGIYLDKTENGKPAWSKGSLLSAIKSGKIGYDWITAVYDKNGRYIKKDQMRSLSIDDVSAILVTTYIYPQPHFNVFQPWVAKEQIIASWEENLENWKKFSGTSLDLPMARKYINCCINYMDCSVTMNYKGEVPRVVQNKWNMFFKYAKNQLKNSLFSSYKLAGIDVSGVKDSNGDEWTQVTTNIHVLMNGWYWNPNYGEGSEVINV